MRSKFKWIFTLLVALTMQFSWAQERTVTGVVSDATGSLPGANVVVKGTTRGTQTDIDGKYSIQAKTGDVLIISFVGMTESSVTVGSSNTIDVKLQEGVKLAEVVIDGYKTTTKKKASVAQTTVTAEAFEGRPNVSFLQSLQSQVAGLNIASASGSPGSSKIDVVLRGYGSVNGNPDPLYVIDNVVSNSVVFRSLNPEDIESITVLKDAGATAIYGNRGTNGVLVITSKKGKYNSKLQVRYSGSTGYSELQQNDYHILNAKQELTLEKQLGVGYASQAHDGLGLSDDDIAQWDVNTNWQDYFFRTGVTQSHNISFTQGGENMSNFTSISYFDQEGIVPTTYFKRFTFRSNFTGKSSNDKFTYFTNFTGSYSKRHQLQQETSSGLNANVVQNPLQGLLASMPWVDPSRYVNGQRIWDEFYLNLPEYNDSEDAENDLYQAPMALLDYIGPNNIPNEYNEIKLLLNASGTYKFTDHLRLSSTAGIDFNESKRLFARAPQSFLARAVAESNGSEFGGIEDISHARDFGFVWTNRLNYVRTFSDKHTIDASFFTEYSKYHYATASQRQDGLDPRTWSFGAGTGYVDYDPANDFYRSTHSASKATAGLFSYFATADYDYNAKYGIVATIRRDASYRFIDDNKWGTFWSISGRWNIDEEKFMDNSSFDQLKLRASYGTTGNQNLATAGYGVNPLYLVPNLFKDLTDTGGGYNGDPSAIFVAQIANRDIQWETTAQLDLGFDLTWKKSLQATVDFYQKTTTDLFADDFVSGTNGIYSLQANTDAKLLNTGVEVSVKYDIFRKGDFRLDVYVNGSYNKNEWKDLVYPPGETNIFQGNVAQANGQPLNAFYLVPYVGVNKENGNLLFLAADGSLTETPGDEDRRFIDKNFIPTYQGGFGFDANYKGFFVNANFSFVADIARFDFDLANLSAPEIIGQYPGTTDFLDAWSSTNTDSNYPSLTATNTTFDGISDRFLRDASYVRLKNLVFGYEVPKKYLDKTFLSGVKVYMQGENLMTWTKWRGFDPENLNASSQGSYPSPQTVSFGLDVQF
jgi:TonB-linked SusC/RagA family outer membrane protein